MDEDRINELLVQWELAREGGQELSAEDLCGDEPKLIQALSEQIELLRASSWMLHDPVSLHAFDSVPNSEDDTEGGDRNLTVIQVLEPLRQSGIVDESSWTKIDALAKSWNGSDGGGFANQLVKQQLLTPYQARVLVRGSSSPLRLDRYVILDSIGSGGMGLVFKALHQSMHRIVAIKILHPNAVDSPEKAERFQREIEAAAKLSHPNVVTAFDSHHYNGTHFLVMEYVEGQNLHEVIASGGTMASEDAICIIDQVADGLQAAHAIGVIHRDIKPTNIMLKNDGTSKLLDLGLARTKQSMLARTDSELTQDGLAMGTASFMSPEQALDARKADERSDIYSLGCTLHYLLLGRPPFVKGTTVQTIVAHREEDAPSLPIIGNNGSQPLQSVYEKMVRKQSADRYQSVAELRHDLRDLMSGVHSPLPPNPSTIDLRERKITRLLNQRWWAGGMLGLALLLITACVFSFFAWKSRSNSHRDLAKWAIALDGFVTIRTDHGDQWIAYADELPDDPFSVVGVDFQSDNAEQSIDPIFSIDSLESMHLTGFDDVQISRVSTIESLQELSLFACDIGDFQTQAIAKMTGLTDLSITDCPLSDEGLRQLSKLENLRYLDVSGTDITGNGLLHLQSLLNLEELVLSNTGINDENLVEIPDAVRHLDLAWCEVGDAAMVMLGQFSKLQSLILEDTKVTEQGIQPLYNLDDLYSLDLSGIPLTPKTISDLARIHSLSVLRLSHQDLTEDVIQAVASLDGIVELDLSETNLGNESLMKLAMMKNVELVDVSKTDVTQAGIDRFNRKIPKIMIYVEEDMR